MNSLATPLERFTRWYIEPFDMIKKVEGGGGAFVAMAIGLFLCERYFRSITHTQDIQDSDPFQSKAAEFLGINRVFFKRFWNIYRHGIQHQGMVKTTSLGGRLYSWRIGTNFSALPAQIIVDGICVICINPWEWTQKMIDIWLADSARLEEQTTHRIGNVFNASQNDLTFYPPGSEYP